MYDRSTLERALQALGDLLRDRGDTYTVVAIGGGALQFRGLTQRSTEDIDIVGVVRDGELHTAEPLPMGLAAAVADVSSLMQLLPHWMNGEPTSLLIHGLPTGFLARCAPHAFGGLTVLFADRLDQIHLKLLAVSGPHDKHYADLRQLQPTKDELLAAARWVRTHAAGEGSEFELRETLLSFGVELDDD